jgi:hypothetical protein
MIEDLGIGSLSQAMMMSTIETEINAIQTCSIVLHRPFFTPQGRSVGKSG